MPVWLLQLFVPEHDSKSIPTVVDNIEMGQLGFFQTTIIGDREPQGTDLRKYDMWSRLDHNRVRDGNHKYA